MIDITPFEYPLPGRNRWQAGLAVEISGTNAQFLAACLQDHARNQGCKAWGEDDGNGCFTVRIWDSHKASAESALSSFAELVEEAKRAS